MRRPAVAFAATAVALAVLAAGCGGGSTQPATSSGTPRAGRTLTVSAAASLTEVFAQLRTQFEAANPGVDVRLNYGGSSDLAQQIVNGAPADVFAAADNSTMQTVNKAGLLASPAQVFVTNKLQIAVPPANPKQIASFADLAKPEVKLVVCAAQVPCGSATKAVEKATGTTLKPVSEEPDVRSVLSKVSSGDADAGLVYVTDVKSANGTVTGIDFPQADQAINSYPIAVLKNAPQPELAARWVELVRGADGQKVLRAAGFGAP